MFRGSSILPFKMSWSAQAGEGKSAETVAITQEEADRQAVNEQSVSSGYKSSVLMMKFPTSGGNYSRQ